MKVINKEDVKVGDIFLMIGVNNFKGNKFLMRKFEENRCDNFFIGDIEKRYPPPNPINFISLNKNKKEWRWEVPETEEEIIKYKKMLMLLKLENKK